MHWLVWLLTRVYVCMVAGDYWPGEAENLLGNISEDARQAGRKGNKGSLTAGGKPRAKSAKVSSPPSCTLSPTAPKHWHQVTALCTAWLMPPPTSARTPLPAPLFVKAGENSTVCL